MAVTERQIKEAFNFWSASLQTMDWTYTTDMIMLNTFTLKHVKLFHRCTLNYFTSKLHVKTVNSTDTLIISA